MRIITIAAGTALVLIAAGSGVRAQTSPGSDCLSTKVATTNSTATAQTPQKAGEGEGQYGAGYLPPQNRPQKVGEGEGQYGAGYLPPRNPQQKMAALPCK